MPVRVDPPHGLDRLRRLGGDDRRDRSASRQRCARCTWPTRRRTRSCCSWPRSPMSRTAGDVARRFSRASWRCRSSTSSSCPRRSRLAVADAQYVVTFGVMLAIGLLISTLTSRLKAQVDSTRLRERRTSALYELGKQLSSLYGGVFLVSAAGEKIAEMTGGEVAVYLRQPTGPPQLAFGENTSIAQHPVSAPAAEWVIEHDQIAGTGHQHAAQRRGALSAADRFATDSRCPRRANVRYRATLGARPAATSRSVCQSAGLGVGARPDGH